MEQHQENLHTEIIKPRIDVVTSWINYIPKLLFYVFVGVIYAILITFILAISTMPAILLVSNASTPGYIITGVFFLGFLFTILCIFLLTKLSRNIYRKFFVPSAHTPVSVINTRNEGVFDLFSLTIPKINKFYPNEVIQRKKWGIQAYSMGTLSLDVFPQPVYVIETDAAYYIDNRLGSSLYAIVAGIILFFFFHLTPINSTMTTDQIGNYLLFFMLLFLLVVTSLSTLQISKINKTWLKDTHQKENHKLTLSGIIPKDVNPTFTQGKFLGTGPFSQAINKLIYLF